MTNAAKEARRSYSRHYYATHKEQHRAAMERYWTRKAENERKKQEENGSFSEVFPEE